ncbi:MAG: hypothetical protein CMP27_16120 [Roseibacillus sp.]|nr:hypothetical protein [Roseibacillus sp.]
MRSPYLAATETGSSSSALICFLGYMGVVFIIAWLAGQSRKGKSFVGEYYLGGRNLGMWAFALTYAATAASGGSFMGFPALIYTHGWSLAWWICGYMVVPLVALSLIAKRINQVGRIAGAITIPELLRKRFCDNRVGNVATVLVVLFTFFYILAQFKAGAAIMASLFGDIPLYQTLVTAVERTIEGWFWIGSTDGDYLVCLCFFALAVIAYTAYGGFRAVVWTDVMQGLVMLVGVLILLGLTLSQVGGLDNATRQLQKQTPPEFGTAIFLGTPQSKGSSIPKGTWLASEKGEIVRVREAGIISQTMTPLEVLIVTSTDESERLAGEVRRDVIARIIEREPYKHGAGQAGVYLTAPGPHRTKPEGFLPVMLALSFFAFWNFSGAGQPSYMIRQMAFRNTVVLRRSVLFVGVFFTLIYLPLIFIFTSARVLLPGMEIDPDRIMPEIANLVTSNAGIPWLAGILVAAPFAAVMSSVDSFLLLVSSGVVRDIYQQNSKREVPEKTLARLSYMTTLCVGILAVIFVLNPPEFLQTLIVFASGGLGACFLVPVVLALYWRRMTARAAVAGMMIGGLLMLLLYLIGWKVNGEFSAFSPLQIHPFIWASVANLLFIVVISFTGRKPDREIVERYFGV